jgi:thiamine transport system substrate-binding protein
MRRFASVLVMLVVLLSVLSPAAAQANITLTLVTHDSFNVSEAVLDAFQKDSGITVQILKSGDAGAMVNQSILSKANPLGDVMFGVDNTFLGRALDADIFEPYESPSAKDVPDEFKLDPKNRVTPIDYGDVCLNYDVAYFADKKLALPESLADLTKPEYKSLLAVENPASSSPGLAFLLATIKQFGTEGDYSYLDFWKDLVANDVYISDSWDDAYYTQFSASSGKGSRPLVVSYASSPPAEVYFADPQPDTAPTGSIIADGTCFRQIEFAGILKGTKNLEAAQKFVDFMLSQPFQEDMPLQMFVFPVIPKAVLPEVFTKYAAIPEKPAVVDFADINANREEWLQAWTETVLR